MKDGFLVNVCGYWRVASIMSGVLGVRRLPLLVLVVLEGVVESARGERGGQGRVWINHHEEMFISQSKVHCTLFMASRVDPTRVAGPCNVMRASRDE